MTHLRRASHVVPQVLYDLIGIDVPTAIVVKIIKQLLQQILVRDTNCRAGLGRRGWMWGPYCVVEGVGTSPIMLGTTPAVLSTTPPW